MKILDFLFFFTEIFTFKIIVDISPNIIFNTKFGTFGSNKYFDFTFANVIKIHTTGLGPTALNVPVILSFKQNHHF